MVLLSLLLACTGGSTGGAGAGGDSGAPSDVPDNVWSDPSAPGPFDVGVTTLSFTDDRGKALVAEVWYPALPDPGDEPDPYPPTALSLSAYRDAPAATAAGPFPLIAFTHGHVAIRFQSAFLMEQLASHGFVLVAPDHPGDTFLDATPDDLWRIVLERPGDVISSVDEVLALASSGDPLLADMIDGDNYVIMGHSLGSITALALGGGTLDFETFVEFCDAADAAGDDWEGCGRVEDPDPDDVPGHELTDERAIATIPMSPGLWYAFGPDGEGLAQVRHPLELAGDQDDLLDYSLEERPVWEAMASDKSLATVATAGHYAFSDICLLIPAWKECGGEEEGYIDMDVAKELTRGMVTAWIEAELLGQQDSAEWLADWLPGQSLVTWERE